MAPGHLLELPDALRGVQRERDLEVVGGGTRVAQECLAAGVDLGGRQQALHPAVGPAAEALDEADRRLEAGPAVVGVPGVLDSLPVRSEPVAGPVHRGDVPPQAAGLDRVGGVLLQPAHLDDGGGARAGQLDEGVVDARPGALLVEPGHLGGQDLDQPGQPELAVADVLLHRLVDGRLVEVGVGVDEARRDDPVGCVHAAVHRAVVARADVDDPVVLDDQAAVTQDPVLPVLEGDDAAGLEEGGGHAPIMAGAGLT